MARCGRGRVYQPCRFSSHGGVVLSARVEVHDVVDKTPRRRARGQEAVERGAVQEVAQSYDTSVRYRFAQVSADEFPHLGATNELTGVGRATRRPSMDDEHGRPSCSVKERSCLL